MKFRATFFNIILLSLGLLAGCRTDDDTKKELTAIRFHLETPDSGPGFQTQAAPVFRAEPVLVNVEVIPFADERDLDQARVIEWMGGPAIELRFNRHGGWMLENVTRRETQRRIAINVQFDQENRWLAAPVIGRPIADGVLTFTPDASPEETDRIVRGLNNALAAIKKKSHF